MRLVLILPVLGRPHRVPLVLESITAATPERHRVLFVADPDDRETITAVQRSGAGLLVHAGGYAKKINAGVRATHEPLIFLGADDLDFRPGWLAAAAAAMGEGVGIVGVNDLGTRRVREGHHATHFLVARWYADMGSIDDPSRLMHEGYHHWYCDDELVATGRARRAIAFASDAIVEHLHPSFDRAPDDETYRLGRSRRHEDRRTFRARSALWA